jgi:integrase/recombinase XerD
VSVNDYTRHVGVYLKWSQAGFKLPKLREPHRVLAVFSPEQIHLLLFGWRPRTRAEHRTHTLIALLLDTAIRLQEAAILRVEDVDLERQQIKIQGKGRKERHVPISSEGRRILHRWISAHCEAEGPLFDVHRRNLQATLQRLCRRLKLTGVRCSPHTLRHTAARTYLVRGGDLIHLQRLMGHSSVKMTERYLQSIGIEELRQVHDRLSPLSGAKGPRR